ncbi:MAG: uracil-DNA glycosylase [bacterium]
MTEKNIIDNIEGYFESVKEQFGDTLFMEVSKKKNKTDRQKSGESKSKTQKAVKKLAIEVSNNRLKTDEDNKITDTKKSDNIELISENNIIIQNLNKEQNDNWILSNTMEELFEKIHNCQNCPLGATRTNFVFGTGNPNADIMIIGEAPGADEDEQGKPFVGRAGQLLTKILAAIKLSRDEVFIANILKCRPPNNRKPLSSEEDECEPYLKKQIELIKPAFILALGLTSVDCLLKKKHKMGDIRGSVLEYHGIKMLVTYHPAALLRNPNWKPLVWEDVKLLRKLYDEYLANR